MISLHAIVPPRQIVDYWIDALGIRIPVGLLSDGHINNIINRFTPRLNQGRLADDRRLMLEAVFRERDRRRN